ncbi:MAG: hypothetical protein EXS08_03980 [Planctomycetes bacterium]|nr:hypothetical protein [Planctomycetota bacterium]
MGAPRPRVFRFEPTLLPTRRGGLALSGELSEACIFPLELRLTLSHRRHASARLVLERPGPFVLSVAPRAELSAEQGEWILVVLQLFAQVKPLSPDGRVRLRLTRMQAER